MVITCGWCGKPTTAARCVACDHEDPARPWAQRGMPAPVVEREPGRPRTDPAEVAHRMAEARTALGPHATVDAIAEALDVSPRTVRRWQKVSA